MKLFVVQIKRLYLLLTVKGSAMDIPSNLEARRRIAFFTNSLFMGMPRAPPVCDMLSFRYLGYLIWLEIAMYFHFQK
jgi:callose synthase